MLHVRGLKLFENLIENEREVSYDIPEPCILIMWMVNNRSSCTQLHSGHGWHRASKNCIYRKITNPFVWSFSFLIVKTLPTFKSMTFTFRSLKLAYYSCVTLTYFLESELWSTPLIPPVDSCCIPPWCSTDAWCSECPQWSYRPAGQSLLHTASPSLQSSQTTVQNTKYLKLLKIS